MNEKNTSNQIIKESIFKALMILMEKKNFNKITITEITEKAGVSRMSFYRNYYSKEDIILHFLDDFFKCHMHSILNGSDKDLYRNLVQYFSYFRENKQLMDNLIKHDLMQLLEKQNNNFLCSLLSNNNIKECEQTGNQYQVQYITGGLIRVLKLWSTNNMRESNEIIAQITYNLIKKHE